MSPSASSAHRDVRLLWAAQFVNTAALMMLVPVMPFYVERLGAQGLGAVALWSGFALAAPALMLALVTPMWGWLGDRIGRRWMLVRALAGLAAGMVIMALATSPAMLIAGRLVQGTLGGVVEAAAGFIGAESDDDGVGRALGRSYSATAAGAVVGPVFGGTFVDDGLQVLMLVTAGIAVGMAVLCAALLRGRGRDRRDERVSLTATLAGAVGHPALRALMAAGFLAHVAVYGLVPVFALHVRDQLPDGALAGAWVGSLHALTWAAAIPGALWWGRRNDRVGDPRTTFMIAGSVLCGTILLQGIRVDPIAFVPLRMIQGFCFAALAQTAFVYARKSAAAHERSAYIGVVNSSLLAGQVAGPVLAALALLVMTSSTTILLLGGTAGTSALLALRMSVYGPPVEAIPRGAGLARRAGPVGR